LFLSSHQGTYRLIGVGFLTLFGIFFLGIYALNQSFSIEALIFFEKNSTATLMDPLSSLLLWLVILAILAAFALGIFFIGYNQLIELKALNGGGSWDSLQLKKSNRWFSLPIKVSQIESAPSNELNLNIVPSRLTPSGDPVGHWQLWAANSHKSFL